MILVSDPAAAGPAGGASAAGGGIIVTGSLSHVVRWPRLLLP